MSHYFTNDYDLTDEREIKVKINDTNLKFITDSNTFSKRGLDYGTRALLESINISEIKGDVLDLGCGWGPIGIYLKKITKSNVYMSDVSERAIKLSLKNALINDVEVNVIKSDSFKNINKKFDFIISNPPIRVGNDILYKILFECIDHLNENGKFYFVINKNQGAKTVIKNLSRKCHVHTLNKNKGFFIICAENY